MRAKETKSRTYMQWSAEPAEASTYAVSKSMPIELRTLKERFILDGYIGLILSQRADFKWSVASTSDSPVKTLSFS
jgi:hypothetical protein